MDPVTVSVSTIGAAEATVALYRALPDYATVPFGQDAVLVYNNATGAREIISAHAERLLGACETFATLGEHTQRLSTQFQVPADQLQVLRNHLQQFVRDGLLISHQELIAKCLEGSPPDTQGKAHIATVGIPTCNRPENLRSCLSSYAQSVRDHQRDANFIVADDTGDDVVAAENIAVLEGLKRQFGIEILYVGKREKEELARALSQESGLPRSIIDFVVLNPENCPVSTGANRNTILLSTVGRPHLQVDDDTTSQALRVPGYRSGLTLTSEESPNDVWFEEELMQCQQWPIVDIFSLHEQLVGKSVSECLAGQPGAVDVDRVSESFLRRLKPSGGRVYVSAMGTAGDSGLGWSNQFLRYRGEARERLMVSEQFYRQAFASHRQVRGALSPTLTDSYYCVSMNLALDNRAQLPPFMPVQRKQDNMFARLVHAAMPDSIFGFMPWTIVHGKPGITRRDLDRGRNRFSDICWNLINMEASFCQSKNVDANLKDIGTALMRIGSMSLPEFEELAAGTMWMMHTRDVSHLQELLKVYAGQPSYWAADVTRYIQDLRQALPRPHYVVPFDLAAVFGDEAARKLAPRLIYRFGEVLCHWQAIRSAAGALGTAHARKI